MEKLFSGFGAPRNLHVSAHGVLDSGWQPDPERTVLFFSCSKWTVASAGRRKMRATSKGFASIASTRGVSSPLTARTAWMYALSALLTPLTSRGKVSFFYLLSI